MKQKIGKKKIAIIVILLAVAAIAVLGLMSGGEEAAMPVETEAARIGSLAQVIAIKGNIEGSDRAEVASAENREIAQIFVKEGDRVSRGQVLALLKASDEEETDNGHAQEQAKNSMELAQFEYEAMQTLYQEGAVSRQELIRAAVAYENSVSEYRALDNTVSRSEKKEITSPIDGTVTRVNASVGLMANAIPDNAPLFVVEDLDHLQMKVKVSEYDVGSIAEGQPVIVSAQVLGTSTVQGVVSRIAPTGEAKELGSKEMVIPVTISITERNDHLIAGVSAKAEILSAEVDDVLIVPLDAVVIDAMTGEQYVMVAENGTVHRQVVEIGLEGDFEAEILPGAGAANEGSGLKEGDRLVLNPSTELTDGMAVTDMTAVMNAEENVSADGEEAAQ